MVDFDAIAALIESLAGAGLGIIGWRNNRMDYMKIGTALMTDACRRLNR